MVTLVISNSYLLLILFLWTFLIDIWEVPKTMYGFNNSLEGLTEPGKKGVILRVMVYYYERMRTNMHSGVRCAGQSSGKFQLWASGSPLPMAASTDFSQLWRVAICMDYCQPRTFTGDRSYRYGDHLDTWLSSVSSSSRGQADTTWLKALSTSHIVSIDNMVWVRASGKQRHSCEARHSRV